MMLRDAVGMALETIRVQKLKSFFSLIGVLIGVTFLIAVVSIVQGMNVYMEDKFANKLIGLNTFQLRRMPNFSSGNVTEDMWKAWQRRPRINYAEAAYVEAHIQTPAIFSRFCDQRLPVIWNGKTAKDVNVTTVDAPYFKIKDYDLDEGRIFTPQEGRAGMAVAVVGWELADKLFKEVDPIGKDVTIEGLPYRVVGKVTKQGSLFGISLDKFVIVPFEARRRDILAQFVVESATISTVGAGVGIATGIGLAFLVRAVTPLPAAVAPWSVAVGVILGVSVGLFFGIYPASRAAKLDPIA